MQTCASCVGGYVHVHVHVHVSGPSRQSQASAEVIVARANLQALTDMHLFLPALHPVDTKLRQVCQDVLPAGCDHTA